MYYLGFGFSRTFHFEKVDDTVHASIDEALAYWKKMTNKLFAPVDAHLVVIKDGKIVHRSGDLM